MARKSRKQAVLTDSGQAFKITDYRVAVYIRLSVEDNKKRGDSVESQRCIIENHIALNPDFEIFDTYIDNGTTGTNFEREGFKRMLADVESCKINCIIVKDLSRLGRNVIDTGYYIEKYFPLNNVRFIAVNDNYDSDDKDSVHGGIILPLKNMINEAYALDQSRKIREQQRQSMLAGEFIGSRPPYGYLRSPDNCHKLIVDKEAALVVRQIFDWAYEGIAVNTIAVRLNEAEITTPSHHKKSNGQILSDKLVGGGKWQTRTINVILSHRVYVGDMVQGKLKVVNHKNVHVDESNWIIVPDTHESIISREIFDAVQERLKSSAAKAGANQKNPFSPNIFKGKIFCECCSKSLHRQRWGKDYLFKCIANERIQQGICGGVKITKTIKIKESELVPKVTEILRQKSESLVGGNLQPEQSENSAKSEVLVLRKSIDANRKYLKGLYENFVSELLTEDEYFAFKSDYETKIAAAVDEIQRLENEQKSVAFKRSQHHDFSEKMQALKDKNFVLTSEIIGHLVEKITVNSDKEIKVILRIESEVSA